MATHAFSDLAGQAKQSWSSAATATYEAASASYNAELAARRDLGQLLMRARRDRQMTQPDLAEMTGIQQAEISRIETGRANPTVDTLTRLTQALGTRLTLA
ncbi:helix-turn-helix domain-containing protein [Acidipropionibacterium virtanenii]|uniref:HTH cro/C1-type domain-containing protein n=1 Tax=Acidipropionibacterium virtanenii TaxID=2057246 RepID=A0A344UWE4_9ACTN|nr:helix-turn-helix transcriptional regulator [Acidipropionibacterium virtanenii]AXE39592.1 hypothetical protein JS278_02454 [Acidipropionibacterium virtanenii]